MLYICNIKPPKHGQDGSGNTNKSAPRPEQGRRETEGEDLTTPPGRAGESAPTRRAFGKPPHKPVYGPRPPGRRPFPGTGSLKKAARDAQANASRPKDAPGASPARPFGKGRHKSRQKENIDIVGKQTLRQRHMEITAGVCSRAMISLIFRTISG